MPGAWPAAPMSRDSGVPVRPVEPSGYAARELWPLLFLVPLAVPVGVASVPAVKPSQTLRFPACPSPLVRLLEWLEIYHRTLSLTVRLLASGLPRGLPMGLSQDMPQVWVLELAGLHLGQGEFEFCHNLPDRPACDIFCIS